jgi:hypothetical protein
MISPFKALFLIPFIFAIPILTFYTTATSDNNSDSKYYNYYYLLLLLLHGPNKKNIHVPIGIFYRHRI